MSALFFQNAAKQAAAAATQTIAASQNAAASNKNTAAHQQLVQSCRVCINFFFFFNFQTSGSNDSPPVVFITVCLYSLFMCVRL